jgi:hypothetical protein
MNDTIKIELTPAEYNIVMRQISTGAIADCLDLFMKLRQVGMEFQATHVPPPPSAAEQAAQIQ